MKKTILLLFYIFVSLTAFCQKPYLKKGQPAAQKKWTLSYKDDFRKNSTIDKNWMPQNASPEHILSSRWRENLSVKYGKLRIKNMSERRGGKEWTSGNMICRTNNGYGYYECRVKIARAHGVNNSFWMSAGRKSGLHGFEIDFFEITYPNVIHYTVHDFGIEKNKETKSFSETFKPDADLSTAYHVYGVDWNENTIDFYFDGVLKWSVDNKVCNHIGPMEFGTAVLPWAHISDEIDNSQMFVDYVRYWKEN